MEQTISSLLAGMFDPVKLLLAIAIVLTARSRWWVATGVSILATTAYVIVAGAGFQLTGAQVLIHLFASALLVLIFGLLTKVWGTAISATLCVTLAALSIVPIYSAVVASAPGSSDVAPEPSTRSDRVPLPHGTAVMSQFGVTYTAEEIADRIATGKK